MHRKIIIAATILLFISCDLLLPKKVDTRIVITNPYDSSVEVTVFGESHTVYSDDSILITTDNPEIDNIGVIASGLYFYSYYEFHDIRPDEGNIITLVADRGWLGLRNMTWYIIAFPKYNDEYFLYDEDYELNADGYLSPGDAMYFAVDYDTKKDGAIIFSITGTECTVTKDFDFPSPGEIETVFIYGESDFQY